MTCRLSGLLLLLAALGCANETGIVVSIDGSGFAVPGDIDAVRIVVRGVSSGRTADATAPIDGTWPQSIAVRPGEAGDNEMVVISVYGLLGNAARVRRVLPAMFVGGSSVPIEVRLDAACVDVACENEVDCRAGMCVGTTPIMDAGPLPDVPVLGDGGPDVPATPDAGPDVPVMSDAGPDVPMNDAGPDVPVMPDGGPDAGPPPGPGTLIISEYLEGSANNKAVELYNASSGSIDLSTCSLTLRNSCGAGTPVTHTMTGSLASGGTWVLCHPSFSSPVLCDESPASRVINHNGDDVYSLECGGTVLDTFGSTFGSCESTWGSGDTSSAERALRRQARIVTGDTDLGDAFDPATEWDGFARDSFDGLGSR